jgi:hypothetical protein
MSETNKVNVNNVKVVSQVSFRWLNRILFYFIYNVSLIFRNESRLIKSPVCLSLGPTLVTSEPLGRFS